MITLLGNYLPDQQESMQRFAALLEGELRRRQVEVNVIRPRSILGGFGQPHRGFAKWCGYVDKLLLFPIELRRRVREWEARRNGPSVVHICDQANAIYIPHLGKLPHLVTCCDLLAIRSSLGEFPAHRTRWWGRQLQKHILRGLDQARRVTCISTATRRDLLRLTDVEPGRADVTSMGLNYPYKPMAKDEARVRVERLCRKHGIDAPATFLLHVGGNQWYKNRSGLIEIYRRLRERLPTAPSLVMAGKALPSLLQTSISEQGLASSIISLTSCDNEDLRSLYSLASYLVFPSLEEGFGWPIIEAQACGCPVITTNKPPMTEVGGLAAVYLDPTQPEKAAADIQRALGEPPQQRELRIGAGLRNAAGYSTEAMIDKYLGLYQSVAPKREEATSSSGVAELKPESPFL